MAKDISILVGTIGAGLWVSHDGGRNYGRAGGIWGDMKVFGLKVDPTDPALVYAGTDEGIFRSTNRGRAFERLDSPMNDMHVWNIAVSPSDPAVIFVRHQPLRPVPLHRRRRKLGAVARGHGRGVPQRPRSPRDRAGS